MDGFESGREPPNWEVFRDAGNALAPVQTKPITRAWERAPVRAHAPRLQGQRIWKKAGIQRENSSTKSSEQDDLDLEGKGARKRMRIAGGKENIGEALFQKPDEAPNVTIEAMDLANNREQEALKYVPRKRTNADHVITPRKPLRPSSGNVRVSEVGTEKSLAEPAEEKPERRRKSMRKSLIKLSPPPAHTPTKFMGLSQSCEFASPIKNLQELSMTPDNENEDKSTHPSVVDELPANVAEDSSVLPEAANGDDAEVEVVTTEPASIVGEVQSRLIEQSLITAPVAEKVELEPSSRLDADQPETEQPQLELQTPDEITQEETESTESEHSHQEPSLKSEDATAPPTGIKIPLNDLEEPPVKSSVIASTENYAAQPALQSEESSVSIICPTSEAHTFGSGEAQDTGPSTPKPRKSIGTPKSKKGGSARQGTRRSTRKASASAVKSEDNASESVPAKSVVDSTRQLTESITPSRNLTRIRSSSHIDLPEEVPSADQSSESATGQEAGSIEANVEAASVQQSASETLQVAPATSQHYHDGEDTTVLAPEYLSQFDLGTPRRAPLSDTLNSESISAQTSASDSLAEKSSSKEREETIEIVAPMTIENKTSMTELLDDQLEDAEADQAADLDAQSDAHSDSSSSGEFSPISKDELSSLDMDDQTVEMFDSVEPGLALTDDTFKLNGMIESTDDLPGSSTPDPTTNELVETISENAMATYEEDDTDMLRNFLSRVKANKAAKAEQNLQKRKRSLPHSPLRLPLGEADTNTSPSLVKEKDEFDVSIPIKSPSVKRRKRIEQIEEEERTSSPKSIRRSGRTRLPVLKAPTVAPSFIPVRRLNQDENTTVTLRRSEEKELAALTKINTRKNKGGALSAAEVLMKKAEEKEDPVIRQRLLKEAFDEKTNRSKKSKKSKSKSVEWAAEIAQFQEAHDSKNYAENKRSENDRETTTTAAATAEDKKGAAVRVVGARKKIALGMAVNGTPAPKRRTRGRA